MEKKGVNIMLMVLRTMLLYICPPLDLWELLTLAAFIVGGFLIGGKPFESGQEWFDNRRERSYAGLIGTAAGIVLWFYVHGVVLVGDMQDNYTLYMTINGRDGSSEKGYRRPLASFGRSFAEIVNQQQTTVPWQLRIARAVMMIAAVALLAILLVFYIRLYKANKGKLAAWNADTFEKRFPDVARGNGVEWATPYENNYLGFRLVDHDTAGADDPWYASFREINLHQARYDGLINGVPGGGLESSPFDSDAIASGRTGEEALARIIVGNKLNVVSFWSLYGKDGKGNPTDKDIDCALVGVDKQGKTHVWFVDAKNYKGGSDTKYVNAGHDDKGLNVIVRISKSQHALVSGKDGRPYLSTSENMAVQSGNWSRVPAIAKADRTSYVCMVPTGKDGCPDVDGLVWTGGVKCVTPKQLVDEIGACDLDDPSRIPANAMNLFRGALKN